MTCRSASEMPIGDYVRVDAGDVLDLSALPTQADHSILFSDLSISHHRDESAVRHAVLKPDELPKPGTMISIDAEFVSLQQEDVEYRSDGTKKVLRPTRMSLARVSVLRGEGEETGVPFIDDHIHTSEPVVDFLTEFSGILRAFAIRPTSSDAASWRSRP